MSNYNTMNPVPSTDPRDLDDNATVFDLLLQSTDASVPDRLGQLRKTWHQMELDAVALVSPNVAALAALTAAADKGVFFSAAGPVAMGTYTLTSFTRGLGSSADGQAFRTAIGAMALSDTGAYSGSAAKLTTPRNITLTGDGSWTVSFDGSATALAAFTLNTVPVAKGGTAATTAEGARTSLGVAASGVNADITALNGVSPAWTALTLVNSWANVAGRRPAGYRKVMDSVQVEAQITTGTATDGTTLFTLPAGCRPAFDLVFPVAASPNAALTTTSAVPRISISASTGVVACLNCTNTPGISFSISFATV
jgi:hypothetical protein